MKTIKDHYNKDIEWEVMPDEDITHLIFENGLYGLNSNCIIRFQRDDQYRLVATISGILAHSNDLDIHEKIKIGGFVPDETVTGRSFNNLYEYRLYGVHIGGTSNFTPVSMEDTTVRFNSELLVYKIERKYVYPHVDQSERLQEWFLSGKPDIFIFPRSTERELKISHSRIRAEIDREQQPTPGNTRGSSRDHLIVKMPTYSIVVAEVIKQYGPEWSHSISIEYKRGTGCIPEAEEREAISELVSFVLGVQLLKVGHSEYDTLHQLLSQSFQSPWGNNIINKCQQRGLAPTSFKSHEEWLKVETVLNQLLPSYFTLRKSLDLKGVLWKYWLAKEAPIGTNLPILSSALEGLADKVLKSHPEIKHYYIEYDEFNKFMEDEFKAIASKLETHPFKERMLNKIKDASKRGSNEKLDMLFEHLGIVVGKVERKAIKARNKMAHSSMGEISEDEIQKTIRMKRAYETLFHRVFLKLLGYENDYIDYYTLGHPSRDISEPIPE